MVAPCTTTLRDKRATRSPHYRWLRNPIYITHPDILIPLLEDAYFDRLPWYYQARNLEESYTSRETPFFWNHVEAEAKRERYLEEQSRRERTTHRLSIPPLPTKNLRRVGKRITFIVKRKDLPNFISQQTIPTPLTTPSSLDSPVPQPKSVRSKPYSLKIKLPAASSRSRIGGAQIAAGVGLFKDTVRRIRAFQRGGSFVWVIGPAQVVD